MKKTILFSFFLLAACHTHDMPIEVQNKQVLVVAGTYRRGSSKAQAHEQPVKMIYEDAFYMDEKSITYREFEQYVREGGEKNAFWDNPHYHQSELPVTGISWHTAVDYCNWRSVREKLMPAYRFLNQYDEYGYPYVALDSNANGYRLPTESQYEYAARGGLRLQNYPNGKDLQTQQANYDVGTQALHTDGTWSRILPAAQQPRNAFGLRGMSGNVWHWCFDSFDSAAYQQDHTRKPYTVLKKPLKVIRGGSWGSTTPQDLTVFRRKGMAAGSLAYDVGFRCVRPAHLPSTKKSSVFSFEDKPKPYNFYQSQQQYRPRTAFYGDWYGREMKLRLTYFLAEFYPNSIYYQQKVDEQGVLNPESLANLIIAVCRKHEINPIFLTAVMVAESNVGSASMPRWYNNPMAYHWENRLVINGEPLYEPAVGIRNQKFRNLAEGFAAFCQGIRKPFYLPRAEQDLYQFHLLYVGYESEEWLNAVTKTYRDIGGIKLAAHSPAHNIGKYIYADLEG